MSSTTPLTDAINALTTYANEVTGKSDETLSDAVESLADGYGGGGSGGSDQWAGLIDGTMSEAIDYQGSISTIASYAFLSHQGLTLASFPSVSSIEACAFEYCYSLTTVNFPYVSKIASSVFTFCFSLTTVSFPNAETIGSAAFNSCSALTVVSFPNVSSIGYSAFAYCNHLSTAIFSNAYHTNGFVGSSAFRSCVRLLSLYLLAQSFIYRLSNTNALSSTPISGYTTLTGGVYGSVFVPESLYSTYVASNGWSIYADRFVSLTDDQVQNVLTYGTHNPT